MSKSRWPRQRFAHLARRKADYRMPMSERAISEPALEKSISQSQAMMSWILNCLSDGKPLTAKPVKEDAIKEGIMPNPTRDPFAYETKFAQLRQVGKKLGVVSGEPSWDMAVKGRTAKEKKAKARLAGMVR